MATTGSKQKNAFSILWRIENFSSLEFVDEWETVKSPKLESHIFEKKMCFLSLDKNQGGNGKCMFLSLHLCDSSHFGFSIDCEWSFVGSDGSNLVDGNMRNILLRKRNPFETPEGPTHEEVLVTRKSEFLSSDTLTVRFRIWKFKGDLLKEELISCRTRLDTSECSLPWPISKFSSLYLQYSESNIPVLIDSFELQNKFRMGYYLKGKTYDDAFIDVDLRPMSIFQDLLIQLKLSILDKEQKTFKCMKSKSKLVEEMSRETLDIPNFVSRKELMKKKSDCLINDVLNLLFEIPAVCLTYSIEKHCYGCETINLGGSKNISMLLDASCQASEQRIDAKKLEEKPSLAFLVEDFLNMYKDQNFTDFELRSGDASFPVHKNVLSARSPVFKAMFSRHMKESGSGTTDVPDLDSHTLNRMLTYIYSGTLEPDLQWENVVKLYYAADKYQVQSLKLQCSSFLCFHVSASNVSDILTLADRHQDRDLNSFVLDFIVSHFDEVMQTKEWETFMASDSAFSGINRCRDGTWQETVSKTVNYDQCMFENWRHIERQQRMLIPPIYMEKNVGDCLIACSARRPPSMKSVIALVEGRSERDSLHTRTS